MQTIVRGTRASGVSCEELGRMGLVDTSGCCKRCHSSESHAPDGLLGPCRVVLADGREAFVCCVTKKHLLGKRPREREHRPDHGRFGEDLHD